MVIESNSGLQNLGLNFINFSIDGSTPGLEILFLEPSWLFKSFEFGNGSRISDKKLILEANYLHNKKW